MLAGISARFSGAPRAVSLACVGLVAGTACSSDGSSSGALRVGLAPSLVFPRALLDSVVTLTLTVYDSTAPADCGSDGTASGSTSKPLTTVHLGSSGCSGGKFCGQLTIDEATDARIFAAVGVDKTGAKIAVGCAKQVVDQAALPLTIDMKRFVTPAVCGDGTVEPTEECDPPGAKGDLVCDGSCHSKEEDLSVGEGTDATKGTVSGKAGDKTLPSFAWTAQTGAAGKFLAVFTDASGSTTNTSVRVLDDSLELFTAQGAAEGAASFYLPTDPNGSFPPSPVLNNQTHAVVATVSGKYYVAYEDDGAGSRDIYLRSLDANLVSENANGLLVNPTHGSPGAPNQHEPSIAANSAGNLYVAWTDDTAGIIRGRVYTPATATLSARFDVSGSGSSNVHPIVAGLGTGWVVVWQNSPDIKAQFIGQDGSPKGGAITVNGSSLSGLQETPSVAGLSDARFAVAWHDHTSQNIYAQRYDKNLSPYSGDQASPVNNTVTGQESTPAVAASSANGGTYAIAWVDGASGHVRARFLGANASDGYLFNTVTGQNDEFQASAVDNRTRANPAIAFGGARVYVAIGWEDTTADANAGIYVRRFPLPTQ